MDYFFSLFLATNLSFQELLTANYPVNAMQASVETSIEVKAIPEQLNDREIHQRMRNLPNWTTDGETLFHTRTFQDFVEAIAFVNNLIEPAEELAHHPDITINYNQVFLQLTTHDANGLTDLDFQLAHRISQI